ncbi:MAG: hypothetical protein D6689_05545, partial [Deltaproteobacteria bacterium]
MTGRARAWCAAALMAALAPGAARAQSAAPQSAGPQAAPAAPPPAESRPYTPEELAELDALAADFQSYREAAERHDARMRNILYREYKARLAKLEQKYAERTANTKNAYRQRHLEAIALLEEFLRKYPNHPKFTPDAMFRLADLYLDEAEYQYEQKLQQEMLGLHDASA